MLIFFISLLTTSCNKHGRLEMQKLGRNLAVADNVYIRSGANIGAQTYNTYQ